jgi:hypothetical protein
VTKLELAAYVTRVDGVHLVNELRLAKDNDDDSATDAAVELTGLELPRLVGVLVRPGPAAPLDELRGTAPSPAGRRTMPVPALAEGC